MARQPRHTKNALIDNLLVEGRTTEEILAAVLKQFDVIEVAAVRRQIYSRRHVLTSRQVTA